MTQHVAVTVITVSNRCARGEREDRSGTEAARRLREAGYDVAPVQVIPDGAEGVSETITAAVDAGARVVLTTGGTGISPQDRTPEGTEPILDRTLPGVAAAIRQRDADLVPTAVLSRGLAGTRGHTLVVNAPGSLGGVTTALDVLLPLIPHVLSQLDGGDH